MALTWLLGTPDPLRGKRHVEPQLHLRGCWKRTDQNPPDRETHRADRFWENACSLMHMEGFVFRLVARTLGGRRLLGLYNRPSMQKERKHANHLARSF